MAGFARLPQEIYLQILSCLRPGEFQIRFAEDIAHALTLCKAISRTPLDRWLPLVLEDWSRASSRNFLWQELFAPFPRWPRRALLLLIRKAGGLDFTGPQLRTPLSHAVVSRKPDLVDLLLSLGADVNRGCHLGRTPLWHCAEDGNDEDFLRFARAFIAAGADVNKMCEMGRDTPLNVAVYHSQEKMAMLLIENGADVLAADRGGRGPIYYAHQKKCSDELIDALSAKGNNQLGGDEFSAFEHAFQARQDAREENPYDY